jgi:DNA repair photolyase
MSTELPIIHGRGAADNPANRFERLHYEPDPDANPADNPAPETLFFRDTTRTILATNDSPDVGFDVSINPYRGCEHGCVYCYARPTHEYLGWSSGLDFETRITVKADAPELLRAELSAKKWKPQAVGISGVTDAYQPIERRLGLTRRCLEVFAEFRNPVVVVTKSRLVTRDRDYLGELAQHQAAIVFVAVTTLDANLVNVMEPRATRPDGRLAAIRELTEAGVPVGVMIAPVIPGLTDHEMPAILKAACDAGATFAAKTLLRLPYSLADQFTGWLERHFPARKERVLGRIRELRGGQLNDTRFGVRMRGEGPLAEAMTNLFHVACRQVGMQRRGPKLSSAAFRRPGGTQRLLFE